MSRSEIVSSPSERLILVDSDDREIGVLAKSACHAGNGIRHRAFSIFLFNSRGDVLLQKRSADKPLWPLFWSNACCSHPREGETITNAARRRLREELGAECRLSYLFKFEYQARYRDIGAENEVCSVYAGQHDGPFDPNASEIDDLRFFGRDELAAELENDPDRFTPWFIMEWQRIEHELERNDGVGALLVPNE